ncbi:hypothetical protein BKA70DRAFT_1413782, partial [Coprinopsis sp. MPI-PUGE-AT-0042]
MQARSKLLIHGGRRRRLSSASHPKPTLKSMPAFAPRYDMLAVVGRCTHSQWWRLPARHTKRNYGSLVDWPPTYTALSKTAWRRDLAACAASAFVVFGGSESK